MQQGSLIARLLLHTNQVIPALGQGADGMVADQKERGFVPWVVENGAASEDDAAAAAAPAVPPTTVRWERPRGGIGALVGVLDQRRQRLPARARGSPEDVGEVVKE